MAFARKTSSNTIEAASWASAVKVSVFVASGAFISMIAGSMFAPANWADDCILWGMALFCRVT